MTPDGKKVPPVAPPPSADAPPLNPYQLAAATELMVIPFDVTVIGVLAVDGSPDTLVQPLTGLGSREKLKLAVRWACTRTALHRQTRHAKSNPLLTEVIFALIFFLLEPVDGKRTPCNVNDVTKQKR